MGTRFLWGGDKHVLNLIVVIVTHHKAYTENH